MLQIKSKSKRLISIFDSLDQASQQSLLDFAEFLQGRSASEQGAAAEGTVAQEPKLLPPQEGETVIQAIKRLSASYPMLDRAKLLNDTSVLMTEHTLQGRERSEVISELEVVFRQHYQNYLDEGNNNNE